MTVDELYQSAKNVDAATFERNATEWFRAKFYQVGGVPAVCYRAQWTKDDNASPFFVLCSTLADKIRSKYEFWPAKISLYGSIGGRQLDFTAEVERYCFIGLLVDVSTVIGDLPGHYMMRLALYDNAKVTVYHTWPNENGYNGDLNEVQDGSHSDSVVEFDLNAPNSIDEITSCVIGVCDRMFHTNQTARPCVFVDVDANNQMLSDSM